MIKIYLKNRNTEAWEEHAGTMDYLQQRLAERSITLGDCVTLGDRVKLGDCVKLGDRVTLGTGVRLGNYVALGDCVKLGDCVTLGRGVKLGDYVTLGNDVKLGDYVTLGRGVKLGDCVTLGNDVKLGDYVTLGDCVTLGNWKYGFSPLQIRGTKHLLNVSSPSTIKIGCMNLPVTKWIKSCASIGKENGYTKKEIAEYKEYILLAQKWMKKHCKKQIPPAQPEKEK